MDQPENEWEVCALCGKKLNPRQTKYCCREHAYLGRRKDTEGRKKKLAEKKPVISLAEIARRAAAEHMTYGKYCEKYGY